MLEEEKQKLQDMIDHYQGLNSELARLENQLTEVKAAMRMLDGGLGRNGEIQRQRAYVNELQRIEDDKDLPAVKFIKGDGDYVISRITPKRIFIRMRGGTHETAFDRQGYSISKGWKQIEVPE